MKNTSSKYADLSKFMLNISRESIAGEDKSKTQSEPRETNERDTMFHVKHSVDEREPTLDNLCANLKTYEQSLIEWQSKFNLVSNSSLENAWQRHFLDSIQLYQYIPATAQILYDLGSGAGFPGMVLAIVAKDRTPYLKVTLIESTAKKTLYLKRVAEITNTDVNIINDRIENIKPVVADVITSRALASLDKLLNLAQNFCGKNTLCIFPKGQKHAEEITEAKKHWNFDCEIKQNETSEDGVILLITNLRRRK